VWPISWMIVGRNTGKDENAMFVKKNMNAVTYDFGSRIVLSISRTLRPCLPEPDEGSFSLRRRNLATFFSRFVRNLAVLGLSGMRRQAWTATRTLGKPSTRKRSRHLAMGDFSATSMMAHAKVLANDVASGAADMKNPVRRANSSRLKKKER